MMLWHGLKHQTWSYLMKQVLKVSKSQKHFFMASHTPKNNDFFLHFFGQIKKIQALYYIKYALITNGLVFFFLIWLILETTTKKMWKFSLFFWSMGSHEKLLLRLTDLQFRRNVKYFKYLKYLQYHNYNHHNNNHYNNREVH